MKLVIMDFDGIIVDTEYIWYDIFKEWFETNKDYHLTVEEFLLAVGADADVLFDFLEKEKSISVDLKQFRNETKHQFIERSKNIDLLPGVEKFIRDVKNANYKLCIATSATKEKPLYHLERFNLLKEFDFLVTSEMVENIKPDPELFIKAIEIAKIDPANAIIIEDSKHGLTAGNRAGIDVIVCPNRITEHDDFSSAKQIVDSLEEIEVTKLF